jgi:hypothetical protein
VADYRKHRENIDCDLQTEARCCLTTPTPQALLFENTVCSIGDGSREIRICPIRNCLKANQGNGKGLAESATIACKDIQT